MSEEKIINDEDDGEDVVVTQEELDALEKEESEGEAKEASLKAEELDEEEGAPAGETAEELSARKLKRQQAKERRRQAEARDKARISQLERENQEIKAHLASLNKRNYAGDLERVDNAIGQTQNYLSQAKEAMAAAVKAQDGEAVAKLTDAMHQARINLSQYEALKKHLSNEGTAGQPGATEQPKPDPHVRRLASDWARKNAWYNPSLKDQDSKILRVIDASLHDEGWDPSDPAYWEELDARAKQVLPHRYTAANGSEANGGKKPLSRPSGGAQGGSGRSANNTEGALTLPRELVRDWKEAGIWDDPKRKARAIAEHKRIVGEQKGRAA